MLVTMMNELGLRDMFHGDTSMLRVSQVVYEGRYRYELLGKSIVFTTGFDAHFTARSTSAVARTRGIDGIIFVVLIFVGLYYSCCNPLPFLYLFSRYYRVIQSFSSSNVRIGSIAALLIYATGPRGRFTDVILHRVVGNIVCV